MSSAVMEFDDFFYSSDNTGLFEFIDYRYLYAATSPRELRELIEELSH